MVGRSDYTDWTIALLQRMNCRRSGSICDLAELIIRGNIYTEHLLASITTTVTGFAMAV